MGKNERIRKQIITPIFLVSYPHFDKPSSMPVDPGKEPKYEYDCTAIFNDTTKALDAKYSSKNAFTIEQIEQLIAEITKKVNGDFTPAKWNTPLKDGREKAGKKDAEVYVGSKFMRLKNASRFVCLDINKKPLEVSDKNKCYGGMYGRAIITISDYNFNNGVGMGITNYLDAFQKIEDGEPLGGGGINAVEEFDDLSAEPAKAVSTLESLL